MSNLKVGDRVKHTTGEIGTIIDENIYRIEYDNTIGESHIHNTHADLLTKLEDEVENKPLVNWKPRKRTLADVVLTSIRSDGSPITELKGTEGGNLVIRQQSKQCALLTLDNVKQLHSIFGEILREVKNVD
jgi:hypothetical protein